MYICKPSIVTYSCWRKQNYRLYVLIYFMQHVESLQYNDSSLLLFQNCATSWVSINAEGWQFCTRLK